MFELQVGSEVNHVPPKCHSLGSAVLQTKPLYSVVPKFTKKLKSSIRATVRNKIWRSFVTEKLHETLCKMFSFDNNIKLAVYLVCILKSLCLPSSESSSPGLLGELKTKLEVERNIF